MPASTPGGCRPHRPSAPSSWRPAAPTRGCCYAPSATRRPGVAAGTTRRRGAARGAAAELRGHHRRHGAGGAQGAGADTDGLPPGRARLSSPYGTDARWAGLQGTQAAWSDLAVAEAFARLDHRRLPVSPPGSTTCRSRSGSATRTFRSRSTCAATTSPRTNAASSSARPAVRPGGARGDGRRHRDPVPASVRGVTVLPQSVPLPAVESRPV